MSKILENRYKLIIPMICKYYLPLIKFYIGG
ncbi:hypothetical protein TPELB_08860 [Terrisporobacter petrolearius]|uniref:Uncharacterized protein n=1 Tax=Terrisporobacter petrolearius TaxID=1460447 RepID=A0ABZ3FA33_9FIRM